MSREAMKTALEALKEPHPGIRTDFTDAIKYLEKVKQAVESLEAALAQPEQAAVPFPSFMRKRIEEAMDLAIKPKGMSVHDGKVKVLVSDLSRMLLVIDSAPPRKAWVSLSDTEINKIVDLNTSDDGGFDIWCDAIAVAHTVCAKLKEKNA